MKSIKCFLQVGAISLMVAASANCTKKGPTEPKLPTLKAHFIGTIPADLAMVNEKLGEYTKEHLGFDLNVIFTDFGDFDRKAQMIINTGEEYDIIFTSSWSNDYLSNSKKGAFYDLVPALESDRYKPLYDIISYGFWEGAKLDEAIYAVPTQKEIAMMPSYLFNDELVREAGFDYESAQKIGEMEPFLRYIKENHPTVIPFLIFSDRSYRGPYDYPLGYGYPIALNNEKRVIYMYDLPDVLDYTYVVRDFFVKGYINQDASTRTGGMQKGELFGLSYADGQPYAEVTWSNESGFKISTTPIHTSLITTSTTRGSMMAISRNSKYPELALDLIMEINTNSEFHNLLNYGIEGIHYEKVGDNTIKRTEQGEERYLVPTFALGNLFNTYLVEGEPEDKWEVFKIENSRAKRSPILGFNFDSSRIRNELAAISNLKNQYEPLLQTGSVDPDKKVEEFRRKLIEVGLEKVLNELQSQIDLFLEESEEG